MITFLRTWANQMIVALMIATIFEMILPNGKNQKYIKMVLGLYVLLTIIQPVMAKVTGNHLEISEFDYKKYFSNDALETFSQDFEENNSKLIEQAYIDNIKNDIQVKLKQKGYEITNCSIQIINDINASNYGALKKINIQLRKIKNEEENQNTIKVNEINVNINNSSTNITTNQNFNLTQTEKLELIKELSKEYSINKEQILIN